MDKTMCSKLADIELQYKEMNKLATDNGIVFFGSDYFENLAFCELAKYFNLDETVYNRSIKDFYIDDIQNMLETCVLDLKPQKVFVNLGDTDIRNEKFDLEDFISKYEWILYNISTNISTDIYIVSIFSNIPNAKKANERLKRLALEYGCKYIDITNAIGIRNQNLHMFDILKPAIRTHQISFYDAINHVNI